MVVFKLTAQVCRAKIRSLPQRIDTDPVTKMTYHLGL
jgi:hypothetical protein